ncbi:cytochrome c oxidase assembly protein [Corynebacterium sp. LK2590]|uniref:cytochrome c oxidase assembly protein n=1 Tax=unclassified Corynebacterium TaxID=2624378 RepID=UPI0034CE6A43
MSFSHASDADATKKPRPSSGTPAVRSSWGIYAAATVFAGVVGGFISMFFLADSLQALGIPDPGRLTTVGLPAFRGAAWMLMALAVGSYLTSAFLISPAVPEGDNERLIDAPLTVDGHLAARTGMFASFGVAIVSLLEIPLVMSDVSGTPFVQVLSPDMLGLALSQVATAQAWLATAVIAVLVGVLTLFSQQWSLQPVLLFLSITMVVPLGFDGHSASGGDHDYGTNSYLWHLLFVVLWVGGLMALIAHGRRLGPEMGQAVRRYSTLALVAALAMAASGVVNAAIRVEWSDWLTTRYGLIITTKTVLLVVLAFLGFVHRQLTIPQLDKRPRLFLRVAVVEVAVMAATVGVAITMGRTPPPPPRDPNLNSMQIQLGYELFERPTFWNVWTFFRFDIMFGVIGLVLAGLYIYALYRLRKIGLSWSPVRTTWWMLGSLGMTVVMSTGIGLYFPAMYSMHMLGHMVLSMVIPLFLVLGAPLTLIMEAFPAGRPGRPSLHDYAVAVTKSRILRAITHPGVNLLQFLVVFYAIYLSFDFYEFAISEHAGHVLMNWMFLLSGYLYFWEVIGPDPLPHRAPVHIRLFVLFLSMPVHLYMGVYLMQLNAILGEEFYNSLNLPWDIDLLADQREGGGIAWGFGQFPLVIVFGKLFVDWLREDRNTAARHDAKADVDHDADLEEYNRMLAGLSEDGDISRFRQM